MSLKNPHMKFELNLPTVVSEKMFIGRWMDARVFCIILAHTLKDPWTPPPSGKSQVARNTD